MKILIFGGTIFLGRYLTEVALKRGHEVTLFNRGKHNTQLFSKVEKLKGDRDINLGILKGRKWDAVIDTCGYLPGSVSASARILAEHISHYTYISTISVYQKFVPSETLEVSPVLSVTEQESQQATDIPTGQRATAETYQSLYGGLKAICEKRVNEILPGRVFIPRPGLIVGPNDYSGRFEYWCKRFADGGDVLCPDQAEKRKFRVIDCRDLSDWIVKMIEKQVTGIYNTTGPEDDFSFSAFYKACQNISKKNVRFSWVTDNFLIEKNIKLWSDLPFWIPLAEKNSRVFEVNNDKAIKQGLTFRPIEETIQDTMDWISSKKETSEWACGLSRERELELINLLKEIKNKL